jgi:HEAT repeat protein
VAVRAAAAKALMEYHDKGTSMAVYALLADNKQPVRLTAAAAYLRTTGTPGPSPVRFTNGSKTSSGVVHPLPLRSSKMVP